MGEIDYMTLQEHYGGKYVAMRDGEVIASADTFDELSDQLGRPDVDRQGLEIDYVERIDVIRV